MRVQTHCQSCGAPVELGAQRCDYCGTPYHEKEEFPEYELEVNFISADQSVAEVVAPLLDRGLFTPNEVRRMVGLREVER